MSRVAGTVAKVVLFVVVVGVATVAFSKDVRRRISQHWAMETCPAHIEADVRLIAPLADPKIDHCEGTPTRATCSLETTERSGRKTGVVKDWDCSKRHISDRFSRELMDIAMKRMAGKGEAVKDRERLEDVQEEFLQSIRYVTEKLRERRELLGETDASPYGFGLFGLQR
ncbi:MAG TPA: hypothetical protein VFN38_11005 [Gemmatimonadaceae bacterium]|nr:hypothetical protein [Gemmatimonadaceae bacterium]